MSEAGDPDLLRANERLKALASGFGNLATVLVGAIVTRVYVDGFGFELLLWIAGAIILIRLTWPVLGLLDAEM